MATLVTGGAGYVGSHTVVELCASGYDVVILDDFSNSARSTINVIEGLVGAQVPVVEGDAADEALLQTIFGSFKIDSVMHFAARKSVTESVADPLGYYRTNLGSTISVAAAALAHGVNRFVFSSSAAVYGTPKALPVAEGAPTAPESPYGASKLMCERILEDAAASSAQTMQVVLLRYFNPVGAHPSALLGEIPTGVPQNLVPAVMQVGSGQRRSLQVFGDDYDTPDGSAVRDYVHVMDIAAGHVAALQAPLEQSSSVFNLGTGRGTSVLELLAAAASATGQRISYEIAARRPGDVAACWADCTRAHQDLHWQAHYTLQDMLTHHWNHHRTVR